MIEQPGEAMAEVENVRVAFPDFGHVWNAAPSELELEIAALSIVIGARVKVRATVARARGRPLACKCSPRRPRFPIASPQVPLQSGDALVLKQVERLMASDCH